MAIRPVLTASRRALGDHLQEHDYYSQRMRSRHSLGSHGLQAFRFEMSPHTERTPPSADLGLGLSFATENTVRWHQGDGWSPFRTGKAGAMLLHPPQTELEFEAQASQELFLFSCPRDQVEQLLRSCGQPSLEALSPLVGDDFTHSEPVRDLLTAIWQECSSPTLGSGLLVDGLWQMTVVQLLRAARRPIRTRRYALTRQQLQRVEELIHEKLQTPLKTSDLAEAVGLSVAQFNRDFKEATGQTPYQFLLKIRVRRARHLVVYSDKSLTRIAYECGFSSQSHMTSVFRSRLGVTPGQLRKT